MVATHSIVIPERVPGVPAVVVVYIGHVVLVIDAHCLQPTSTAVVAITDVDILRFIKNW